MEPAEPAKPKKPRVGRVLSIRDHPNADRISIATVEIGDSRRFEIVVGGNPLPPIGDFVPVAIPGTRLVTKEKIRPRRYRGVRSHGELLSSTELGWVEKGPDCVLIFPPDFLELGSEIDSTDAYPRELVTQILERERRIDAQLAEAAHSH